MLDIGFFQKNSHADEGQQELTKNAGDISNDMEGLEIASHKMQRASAEGKQVVPGSAPEVVHQYDTEKILAGTVGRRRSWCRLIHNRVQRTRIIWAGISLLIFAIGVGLGCAIVKSMESNRNDRPSVGVQTTYAYLKTTFMIHGANKESYQIEHSDWYFEFASIFSIHIFKLNDTHFNYYLSDWISFYGHYPLDGGDEYLLFHLIFFYFGRYSYIAGYIGIKTKSTGKPSRLAKRISKSVEKMTVFQTFTGNLGGALADPVRKPDPQHIQAK